MKKIRQINGFTIYQATSPRDEENHNCHTGNYNVYLSSDIRDFGLSYSTPAWEDEDSLSVVIARCNGSKYAVACALAEEISGSTAQDMDLVLEIERRLDDGQSLEQILRELDPCYLDEEEEDLGDMDVAFDHENWWTEPDLPEDDLGGDLEDILDHALSEETPADNGPIETCRDWMKAHHPEMCGSEFCGGCKSCPSHFLHMIDHCEDMPSCQDCWDQPLPEAYRKRRSHASYIVVRDPDTGEYSTLSYPLSTTLETQEDVTHALLVIAAKHYAFSDCGGWDVEEIVIDGDPIEYAGWHPGMEFIFINKVTGEIVFDEYFPNWDH